MLAGIHACLGNKREAKEALAVFLQNTPSESISKERREWDKIWTAPGSLDRWIKQMRFAGCRSDGRPYAARQKPIGR